MMSAFFFAFLFDEECSVPTSKHTMDMNSRLRDFVFLSFPKIKLKYIILLVDFVELEEKNT